MVVWPSFDMSKQSEKLEIVNIRERTPEQVKQYLEIDTYDFNTIDLIASRSNVSFITCYDLTRSMLVM